MSQPWGNPARNQDRAWAPSLPSSPRRGRTQLSSIIISGSRLMRTPGRGPERGYLLQLFRKAGRQPRQSAGVVRAGAEYLRWPAWPAWAGERGCHARLGVLGEGSRCAFRRPPPRYREPLPRPRGGESEPAGRDRSPICPTGSEPEFTAIAHPTSSRPAGRSISPSGTCAAYMMATLTEAEKVTSSCQALHASRLRSLTRLSPIPRAARASAEGDGSCLPGAPG